ncbi:hypothetical protein CsSME_00052643 [Camellia sinensis var. sinensis]
MKHLCKELSEDCWELILNRLAIDDVNLLLVCKLFLSITDRLRLKLDASNKLFYSHNCEGLLRALQRFTKLQEIELRDPIFGDKADVNYPLRRIASSGLDLQSLCLRSLQKPPFPKTFMKLGSTMNNLKILWCCCVKGFRNHHLVAIADALPWLEELDIQFFGYFWNLGWSSKPRRGAKHMVTDAGIEVMSYKLRGLLQDDLFTFKNSMIYAISLRSPVLEAKEDHDRLLSSISTSGIRLEKILIYDDSGLSFHGLSNFLCGCPSLTHLTLCSNNFLIDNYMRDLCRYLPNLVSIKFNQCSNITTAMFFILAKECPMLSEIGLPNIKPQVEDDFNLELKRNYRIRSLDLTCSVYLNDEFIKKVGAICPNLQTLNLNRLLSLTTEGIGEILRCCSQIKHLTVDRTRDMAIFLEQFKTRRIKIGHGYNLEGLYD